MRRILPVLIAFLISATITLVGCKHSNGVIVSPEIITPAGPGSGDWVVSFLTIRATNMNHHLDGYTFSFNEGGMMSVNTNIEIIGGTWKTSMQKNNPQLAMAMVNADPMLAELNHEWTMIANTDTSVILTRGTGYTYSEIHFTKH